MVVKYPIEFNLSPQIAEQSGTYWVTLALKNIGSKILSELDVRLNSRFVCDYYSWNWKVHTHSKV